MVRSKKKIQYPLPDQNCLQLEILFTSSAKGNRTLSITNTKREELQGIP